MCQGVYLTLQQLLCICSTGWGITFLIGKLLAKLLDQLVDLGMYHDLILIPNAVLTQEVKLDMVVRHALHILNLPTHSRNTVTNIFSDVGHSSVTPFFLTILSAVCGTGSRACMPMLHTRTE